MPSVRLSSRRSFNYLAYTLIGVTLLLVLLPQIVSQGLVYGLGRIGAGAVSVENVDINLFTGRLALDELQIYRAGARVLRLGHGELEIDWHTLWKRRLQLKELQLQNLSLTVRQATGGALHIAGYTLPPATDSGAPATGQTPSHWGYGLLDLSLQNIQLDFIRPGLNRSLSIKQLSAGPLRSWEAETPTTLRAQLGLSEATLKVDASSRPFATQPSATATVQLAGFHLNELAPLLPGRLGSLDGTLSSDLKLAFKQDGKSVQLKQSGQLKLSQLQLLLPDQRINAKAAQWDGDSTVTLAPAGLSVSLDGQLDGNNLDLALPANKLSASAQKLRWQGSTHLAPGDKQIELNASGNATLDSIDIGQDDDSAPHTTLSQLVLNDISLQSLRDLHIGGIHAAGLNTSLRLTPEGLYPLQLHQTAAGPQQPQDSTPPASGSEPLRLRIDSTVVDGDNRIRFEDTTTSPSFVQALTLSRFTLGSIDSGEPTRAAPFEIDASPGSHSSLSVKGSVALFAQPLGLRMNATLNDYEMPPLTPYLVRQIGYKINNGQLDSRLRLTIANHTMEGEVKLTARQLEMEPESQERIKEFEQRSNMPVNTALGLLRDGDNNINLTIPLSGNLNDPQFDFSNAINTALAKTLRTAAVSYLKYLLQPYSSVITLVQLAGKAGGGVQLEPITFEAANAEPDAKMQGYIEKLAQLFSKRDNLQLRLCGIATRSDLVALSKGKRKSIPPEGDAALEKLARQRAENLKDMLVQQYGIDPARLYICLPELEDSDEAVPRVRVQL